MKNKMTKSMHYIFFTKHPWYNCKDYKNAHIRNMFSEFGFEDVSWKNDCCPSFQKEISAYPYSEDSFMVYLPNSENDNHNNEEFNQYIIHFQLNTIPQDEYLLFDSAEDVIGFFMSNLNQIEEMSVIKKGAK